MGVVEAVVKSTLPTAVVDLDPDPPPVESAFRAAMVDDAVVVDLREKAESVRRNRILRRKNPPVEEVVVAVVVIAVVVAVATAGVQVMRTNFVVRERWAPYRKGAVVSVDNEDVAGEEDDGASAGVVLCRRFRRLRIW